jgi:hypothetical protein
MVKNPRSAVRKMNRARRRPNVINCQLLEKDAHPDNRDTGGLEDSQGVEGNIFPPVEIFN